MKSRRRRRRLQRRHGGISNRRMCIGRCKRVQIMWQGENVSIAIICVVVYIAKLLIDFGDYRTVFSLEGVPKVGKFIQRPAEMAELECVLLPRRQKCRQNVFVLHGLGGIGKTQLVVEFARLHHRRFSSVFWLDGRSRDSLKRSIASSASRIAADQISETSRTYSAGGSGELDVVVKEVMGWLARPDNTDWLLVIDNVDRDYDSLNLDPDTYDVREYFSGAEHGAVLITTRLARLEQLGGSQQLGKVNSNQSEAILRSWYKKAFGKTYVFVV